jgi:hypothetical protein
VNNIDNDETERVTLLAIKRLNRVHHIYGHIQGYFIFLKHYFKSIIFLVDNKSYLNRLVSLVTVATFFPDLFYFIFLLLS